MKEVYPQCLLTLFDEEESNDIEYESDSNIHPDSNEKYISV